MRGASGLLYDSALGLGRLLARGRRVESGKDDRVDRERGDRVAEAFVSIRPLTLRTVANGISRD